MGVGGPWHWRYTDRGAKYKIRNDKFQDANRQRQRTLSLLKATNKSGCEKVSNNVEEDKLMRAVTLHLARGFVVVGNMFVHRDKAEIGRESVDIRVRMVIVWHGRCCRLG